LADKGNEIAKRQNKQKRVIIEPLLTFINAKINKKR
jgi:hypothetical protein